MYTEVATLEFYGTVPQSARLRFLEGVAESLERAVSTAYSTDNPGYSLELAKSGRVRIVIWHPWKANALWPHVISGHAQALFRIISPKGLAKELSNGHDGRGDGSA